DKIAEELTESGYTPLEKPEKAELVIINSCTVTGTAASKSRKSLNRFLNRNPGAIVIFAGCYAADLKEKIETGSFTISPPDNNSTPYEIYTGRKETLSQYIAGKFKSSQKKLSVKPHFQEHIRPFIKIQDGCDNSCTYCKVCLVRGPSISFPQEIILDDIRNTIIKKNPPEIVLTGINIGVYDYNGLTLAGLLKEIIELIETISKEKQELTGNNTEKEEKKILSPLTTENIYPKIRLSSIEPQSFSDELILIIKHPLIQPHFHIPLQSGSDRILKIMKRKYTRNQYLTVLRKIREVKKDTGIGTDIITGFPGETEEDVKETMRVMEELDHFHIFPFSPMEGTKAYTMKKLTERIIFDRKKQLIEHGKKINFSFRKKFLNKTLDCVRVDKRSVLTGNYINVELPETGEEQVHNSNKTELVRIIKVLKDRTLGNF
ncbi:MAG: radical SAM protein, partial [Actinomycetia bacterium]|nr:radical SAM protein [Actinomycetes bacterium]